MPSQMLWTLSATLPLQMKVNFKIKDNYAIEGQNEFVDLHNAFDFIGFDYNVQNDLLTLRWSILKGYSGIGDNIEHVALVHKATNYLQVTGKDPSLLRKDDSSIDLFTFHPSDERETNDEFMLQELPNENDDILYTFCDGLTIRVNCEEIEMILEQRSA